MNKYTVTVTVTVDVAGIGIVGGFLGAVAILSAGYFTYVVRSKHMYVLKSDTLNMWLGSNMYMF